MADTTKIIQKDTCIENYGKLYTTTIYGGGCGASVTGDVTLKHEGFAMKILAEDTLHMVRKSPPM